MAKKCEGVKKGAWTNEEDNLLRKCIDTFGEGKWHQVPLRSGLNRCRQSCRLRWMNYLKPNLKRGYFTKDEVDLILRLHKLLGNRWSLIAGRVPGRTANDVKNFWNTHISKKSAATKQSRSKSKTSRKAINNTNIIRPRPRTLIFPKLDFLSHSNDENLSNIMKPPSTPQSSNPDTMEDENKEFFKEEAIEYSDQNQTCESLLQEEMDHCIQWWSSLLETTKNVQPFSEEGSLSSLELSGPGSGNNAEVDGLRCLPAVDTLMLENL